MDLQFLSQCTEVHGVILKKVAIGKIITDIEVAQAGSGSDQLAMYFKCGYSIFIDERGITLQRNVRRPEHDHDDTERLYINKSTGRMEWIVVGRNTDKYAVARIPFGSVIEGNTNDRFY